MLRRLHVHPLLLAAAPVLLLWATNADEVAPAAALPVLRTVLLVAIVSVVAAVAATRDLARGTLVTSAAALVVLTHGYLLGDLLHPWLALAGSAALVVAGVVWVLRADEATIGRATVAANLAGIALVLAAVPGVLGAVSGQEAGGPGTAAPAQDVADLVAAADRRPTRDIFYIVPDRYGRDDSLRETFGIDNGAFTQFLRDEGFVVLDEAVANYPATAYSLASALGMDYLDDLDRNVPADQRDSWQPVYDRVRDHRLGRVLDAVGYEYVHVGTWWSASATAASADDVRNYETATEFASVFEETTAVPALRQLVGADEPATRRETVRAHSAWQLDELDQLAREVADTDDAPRFVFVHITLPHSPYVFDRDGSVVTAEQEASRGRAENYARQLEYLNTRLRGVVEQLTDQPEETAPIVVLQADEGPHPDRATGAGEATYDWGSATDTELREKFRILSAYHLPGVDAEALVRPDMTPVNGFRLVLDTYLGTELGQLEDRSHLFPDRADRYASVDVTDRVRGTGGTGGTAGTAGAG